MYITHVYKAGLNGRPSLAHMPQEEEKRGKGSVQRILLDTVSSIQTLFSALAGYSRK
jgi:hypothetical protein